MAEYFVESFYDKGLKYAIQGNFREAKKQFSDGLTIDPLFSQLKQGLRIVEDVLEQRIKPQTAIHLFKSANYANQGLLDESIAEDEKAITYNPSYAVIYNSLGTSYIEKSQYDKAVLYLDRAIELEPVYYESYVMRGLSFSSQKLYGRAIQDFNKAINICPADGGIYFNRALAYYFKREYRKAARDANQAESLGYPVPRKFSEKIRHALNNNL